MTDEDVRVSLDPLRVTDRTSRRLLVNLSAHQESGRWNVICSERGENKNRGSGVGKSNSPTMQKQAAPGGLR